MRETRCSLTTVYQAMHTPDTHSLSQIARVRHTSRKVRVTRVPITHRGVTSVVYTAYYVRTRHHCGKRGHGSRHHNTTGGSPWSPPRSYSVIAVDQFLGVTAHSTVLESGVRSRRRAVIPHHHHGRQRRRWSRSRAGRRQRTARRGRPLRGVVPSSGAVSEETHLLLPKTSKRWDHAGAL